ncbi:DUF550 domain-containing protein [Salmonella enterica subsp. enterica serovar Weltevreden]|uniref:dATP/dGTP pyrophosphohydrolase domain-containing protein n=1 Tax=Salmonella enterica TaxID=28901 RepID=UPI00111B518F|nr:DUF550 domain-containing protein [Salmonella enterica subsp. enterica serovar Weltevreden]EDA4430405.1 DUF550 domain-containing protein [Salmonella enterica]EEA8101503.1 DUF550 domain-containing protein [Salmonella enterica subsp. enterica]EEE1069653.1 DUF550 domain-containing protein [Salmonella enterica subsp. enterica serovar Anatum]EDX2460013.1 DUF550 domain-containing protein [Salmonella enterica subsp. enterica serovar Weltevreden]
MITITKERLLTIKQWRETYGPGSNVVLPAEEVEELARIALAALEAEKSAEPKGAEPVAFINGAWTLVYYRPPEELGLKIGDKLYTAPPASECERIRREHAEWSDKTFGDVGPVGPLKHLSKEALETAAEPDDLSEWADMQFLLWDAQRRAGITDKQITLAMVEKLAVNKKREWPEPKDGEPRLHIKEQPATVVPDEMATSDDMNLYQKSFAQGYNACRAAMLQGVEPVSNYDELALYYLQGQKNGLEWAAQLAEANHPHTGDWLYDDPLELAKAIRKGPDMPEFAGSSPVTQDGWISCSERMPDSKTGVLVAREFGRKGDWRMKWATYIPWHPDTNDGWLIPGASWKPSHWMPLPEPPQEVK